MSESQIVTGKEMNAWLVPGEDNAKLIYVLYLISLLPVLGIVAIVGVVIAYVNRGQSEDWIESHYTYMIRTFWIGLLFLGIGIFLLFVLIGIPVLIAVNVWVLVRCIVGLMKVAKNEPITNPTSWWI